ncbi:hypothetical protein QP027_01070 [Corynebacterium breve]|uniref:Peptidase S1 domain-containing protein n=1 Tax=Corynebacterium breve TaxID=3049799 RepID=A0ABY8VFA4_9CORY|nr:hypothetical protein [Corynebacterium breve]WIM68022.1 hypothetical protein QP027_01070 [Corynebacterium breve]
MNCRHVFAALIAATTLCSVPAAVAAPVGPGAPVRTYPVHPVDGIPAEHMPNSCSQGVAGTIVQEDGTTKQIMITAAHCLVDTPRYENEIGTAVYAPKTWGDQLIGYRVATGDKQAQSHYADLNAELHGTLNWPDWGVVELEDGVEMTGLATSEDHYGHQRSTPVAMTGVRDYRDLGATEISVDNFGQPICKDGQRSARSCGVQLFRASNSIVHWGLTYESGDSGGVNYDPNNGEVLGVTSQGIGPLGRAQVADQAIQTAYGIPDGQVNEQFQIAPAVPLDDDFRTVAQDDAAFNEWAAPNGVDPIVDYRQQFKDDFAAAEADFHAGNIDSWQHHAETLPTSAVMAGLQEALGM